MKQFWLEVLEEIRAIGLMRMLKCCFIAVVQAVRTFFRIIFGCLFFTVMTCVIYQNGWIPWLGYGKVSTEMFQTSFWSLFYLVFSFCIVRKALLLFDFLNSE